MNGMRIGSHQTGETRLVLSDFATPNILRYRNNNQSTNSSIMSVDQEQSPLDPTDGFNYNPYDMRKCGYDLTHNRLSQFVARGSYGFVYRPSYLSGKIKNCLFDRNDHPFLVQPETPYVTKIGITQRMLEEYQEYEKIKEVDPQYQYHYPKPIMVDNNHVGIPIPQDIKTHFLRKYDNLRQFSQNKSYSFLVLNDGGQSLSIYTDPDGELEFMLSIINCKEMLMLFSNILHGIRKMNQHNVMHYDVKAPNIVYDKNTKKMRFIDFGLCKSTMNLTDERIDLRNAQTWFNYPIEKFLITNDTWDRLVVILKENDETYSTPEEFADMAFNPDPMDNFWYRLFVPHPGSRPSEAISWIQAFLNQLDNIDNLEYHFDIEMQFKRQFIYFLYSLKAEIKSNHTDDKNQELFERVMHEYSQKIDIFGAGLTLLCILAPMRDTFYTNHIEHLWFEFTEFSLHLVNCNLFQRYDAHTAISKYEDLLGHLRNSIRRRRGGKAISKVPRIVVNTEIVNRKLNTTKGIIKPEMTTTTTSPMTEREFLSLILKGEKVDKATSTARSKTKKMIMEMEPPEKVRKNQEFDKKLISSLSHGGVKSKKIKKSKNKTKKTKGKL